MTKLTMKHVSAIGYISFRHLPFGSCKVISYNGME